ncbi:MAG: hypothetical protein IPK22_19070 [Verrucomicrobiaceae bacterium]|nr:hypothetical protein [Verrucomicrobiaceae bacterium]
MKSFSLVVFSLLCASPSILAADELAVEPDRPRWRFGASYAPMIGMRTEFAGFGSFQNLFPLPALGPATNYTYTNGSVLVDSTGNFGGLTTNWSYTNNSQYNPAGTGSINYTALGANLNNGGHASDDNIAAAAGFEFFGYLDIGNLTVPVLKKNANWGLRTGFHYARVDTTNRDSISAGIASINDSFDLGGAIPPLAPYPGFFTGPASLLSDTPTRTIGVTNAIISGSRSLDVHLAVSSVGGFLEFPLHPKVKLSVEGGLILAIASGTYSYTSTVSVPGSGTQTSQGSASQTKLLPGVYTGLALSYEITEKLALQTSARYQFMRQFELNANGSTAALNFDSAFVLSLGMIWKF